LPQVKYLKYWNRFIKVMRIAKKIIMQTIAIFMVLSLIIIYNSKIITNNILILDLIEISNV